ncbi:MAG: hypothetical protein AB1394_07700, partial [Bacteroidota bacterium]
PLRLIANGEIINVGSNSNASKNEEKLWKRVLAAYEFVSRAKSLPIFGKYIFSLLDVMLRIPSFYPLRDLSNKTFQVEILEKNINKGLCSGMLEIIETEKLPLVTSFYAPAIAANMKGINEVYCIICDADLNRVWVAKEPWESRIVYFTPCGKASQRLKAYGVPNEKIATTGFPIPIELLGSRQLDVLKKNLAARLKRLDPKGIFWARHGINVEHFLGKHNCSVEVEKKITLVFNVGGAGAQKEIGSLIAHSLKDEILKKKIKLYLAAGTKVDVKNYFEDAANHITEKKDSLEVIYGETTEEYFNKFNQILHSTDILWTKPSELSFYCALGLPIIIAPAIGSQEKFNRKWLLEIRAGIKQIKPEYTHQWLFSLLENGSIAEAAWSGFLRARKLGTYNILDYINNGYVRINNSPVMR